jgi:hypothetical protein
MRHTTIDGTPIVFTDKLKIGEFQHCRQFLFCGTGTDLTQLAVELDRFDAEFLKDCGIAPIDNSPEMQ